ncbi:glycosyltransferase [Methanooceanicella nereidis]|uniref:glycosyltransferase n=1 Tax=Methanooceanicella nereidis TaxID=2052831 RepID=UPI001E4317A2|nr:glycosyltransferase [Methanocella sp. CWC-04]
MKAAIIRGSNMNPFEMQSYAPLRSQIDITGYASYANNFETEGIRFPVKRLHTFEEYYRFLPSVAKGVAYGLSLPRGMNGKMFGLEKELEDKDILHAAETSNGYSYQAARVKKEKNKKLVLTVWENIPFLSTKLFMGCESMPGPLKPFCKKMTKNGHIVKYVKDNTDIFIAVTERAKQALIIEGVPEDKIRTIPVGVDTERFKPADADPALIERFGLSDNGFNVLFMGRLVKEKGIYDLLYAAKLLSLDVETRNIKILIAGSGPEKDNMAKIIKDLAIDRQVSLIGSFSYEQVPKLYNVSDAFILPSITAPWWQEQFGMVLVEAMASRLPVISTLSGSIPEVLGDGGILIQPDDPFSIYREIKNIMTDKAYRERLKFSARERAVEEFSINKISKMIGSVYSELM